MQSASTDSTGDAKGLSSMTSATAAQTSANANSILNADELFTDRDLQQTADTSSAKTLTLTSGQDVTITEEGVYLVSGTASNASIIVDANSQAKVQIVLDGVTITNDNTPAIYVKSADKVFVTTVGTSTLSVTGEFAADGDTNTDAVIFSKDDLVLNGTGTLVISSTDNAVTSKDDLKITGGTYEITCAGHAFEANDSVVVADGTFKIVAGDDGLHADNEEDGTLGYVYVGGGTFQIKSESDGIHATSVTQIDGGTFTIVAPEAIEGTYVQINGGTIDITASDDGINASARSTAYSTTVEINGGDIKIVMGAGDTDAIDSNGNLFITGGTIDITAASPFDFDGTGSLTGGTLTVNGQQVTQLSSQMMGGMGGMDSRSSASAGSMGGPGMQGQGSMGSRGAR